MKIPRRKRKVTTITLNPEIVEKAKKYNLNISRLSEDTLKETIRKLEHEAEPMGAPKVGKKGGEKEMTSKLPWAAAIVIMVAAGLGAWAILGGEPAAPTSPTPPSGTATITIGPGGSVVAGDVPTYSGIENIYIVKDKLEENGENQNYYDNFASLGTDNVENTITASSGQTKNINYNENFAIVVAVKGHTDNMANVVVENMHVYLSTTGTFTDTENTAVTENRFIFDDGSPTYIRVNHVCDNQGDWYRLPAGGSIDITVSYYTYQ